MAQNLQSKSSKSHFQRLPSLPHRIRGAAERRANVLGVYRMAKNADVRDKRILLIDDVITTGATAGEAARILLTAGAKEVHLGCIAAAASDNK